MSKETWPGPKDECPRLLDPGRLAHLPLQKRILFTEDWNQFIAYLGSEGKNPELGEGYAESNIRPISRRLFQVYEFAWDLGSTSIELGTNTADEFIGALVDDTYTKQSGEPYAPNSKRKFTNVLQAYFRFKNKEWLPEVKFSDGEPENPSDPFTIDERELLFETAIDYRSPPSYKNVCPEERDRWKADIAQRIGRPKSEIGPEEWSELRRSWKYPALIAITLDTGFRAALIGRLRLEHLELDDAKVIIPPEIAVKNDRKWPNELTNRSVKTLRRWKNQRKNKVKYDGREHVFLNRQANPYNSGTLNDLLDNLLEEGDIEANGRKLTWHSIRHSLGMYTYYDKNDLGMVAEVLRQVSLEAARKYAHPTPESKKDLLESMQGDDFL